MSFSSGHLDSNWNEFLYSYESELLDNMIRSGHRRLARAFNLCYRYIDDLIVFNKKKFGANVNEIYPSQVTVKNSHYREQQSNFTPSFMTNVMILICTLSIFPLLSSNIPSSHSYGVYIPNMIRYARCCSHYDNFGYCNKLLVDRLLSQEYEVKHLKKKLWQISRYH